MNTSESVLTLATFYEKKVRSFEGLIREIRHLDSDSGVRVIGSYHKRDCFAFLTRSGGTTTVMVYVRRGHKVPRLGARILTSEFKSVRDLESLLKRITEKGVDAYVY